MGIGGGIFLIAAGAILAFAVKIEVSMVDLRTTGWVLMLAGFALLTLTLWFWRSRRQRQRDKLPIPEVSVLEETQIAHGHAIVEYEPPGSMLRPPPQP
jgi:LPXTG-motif cell wall-anchored protein